MSLTGTLTALNEGGVEYVVIGGVAATAQGSAYVTFDVDICYARTDDNQMRLVTVLQRLKAYLRGVEPGLPFTLDARTLRNTPALTLVTSEGDLDVMDRVGGVGEYEAVLAASEPTSLFSVPTRVLSLDALIASKRAVARAKDQIALVELEALRELRRGKG